MSYGHDKGAQMARGSLPPSAAGAATPMGGVGAGPAVAKNSVLQNLTSRLEGQCSSFENQIRQLERIVDRLAGGSAEAGEGRTDPPPAYSCVGALSQLADVNDARLKAFAYQLSRLEEAV